MSYRSIEVDGKEYLWTIGKTHVKIRGLAVIPRVQFAHNAEGRCSCGSFGCNYDVSSGIGPGDIAHYILAAKKDKCLHSQCPKCRGKGVDNWDRKCIHYISCPCSRCSPASL